MCNGPVLIWWMKYMIYTESAWEPHIVLLYERLQNYFKTKEPVRSSKKRENSKSVSNHNASCCPVTDVFFVKRLESQGNNMLKTVKCMTKTAEDSVKEATKRKQDQHILFFEGARY